MEPKTTSASEFLKLFWRTVPALWRSAPLLVGLMFVLAVVSGLVAPLSIMLTKWTVDGVTRFAAFWRWPGPLLP